MIELHEKLDAAVRTQQRASQAHAQASFAVEEGTATAADLAKASKELQAADKRVADLRAAVSAGEEAEAARVAQENEARKQARMAALNQALEQLREQGTRWDAALDELARVSGDVLAAVERVYGSQPMPEQVRKIENARGSMLSVVQYRLREFLNSSGPLALSPERDRLSTFVNHLPEVNE